MEQPGADCNQMPRQHFIVKQFILSSFSIHSLPPAFNAPLISRSLEPIEFVEEVQNSATASFYRLHLAGSGRFLLECSIQPDFYRRSAPFSLCFSISPAIRNFVTCIGIQPTDVAL